MKNKIDSKESRIGTKMNNFIEEIKKILLDTIVLLYQNSDIPNFAVEKTKTIIFGNYSSNIAMVLSKTLKDSPMNIGESIIAAIDTNLFEKIEVVKPGFINFYFSNKTYEKIINDTNKSKQDYGQYPKNGKFVNIEYVSANPTGSLHLGHARNAAVGSSLGYVLEKYGYEVDYEYYINDAGNQINILGVSVLTRYFELFGKHIKLDETFYNGPEPKIVAKYLKKHYGDKFLKDEINGTVITNPQSRNTINNFSKYFLMEIIKYTLEKFNCKFDIYYQESNVYRENLIPIYLKKMIDNIYLMDNAIWLNTTINGDDKDRVLVKSDGNMTYLAPDVVYHAIKLSRKNYEIIFDILGSDHGSYLKRMQAAIISAGFKSTLHVVTLQMIKLTKNGETFKMSKRTGVGITMLDLIEAIGVDAARWYLLVQDANSHLEIDIEKCMRKDNSNQLYYVFYSYARITKIIDKIDNELPTDKVDFSLLTNAKEKELADHISFFPILIKNVAEMYELQKICTYLYELANLFHSYYTNVKIIDGSNIAIQNSRINLINAVKWTITSGLALLGIDPKNKI